MDPEEVPEIEALDELDDADNNVGDEIDVDEWGEEK